MKTGFLIICGAFALASSAMAGRTAQTTSLPASPQPVGQAETKEKKERSGFFDKLNSPKARLARAGVDASNGLVGGLIMGREAYMIGKSAVQGTKDAAAHSKAAWRDKKYAKSVGYGGVTVARPVAGLLTTVATGVHAVGTAVGGAVLGAGQILVSPLSAARRVISRKKQSDEELRGKVMKHNARWGTYLEKSSGLHNKVAEFLQGHGPPEKIPSKSKGSIRMGRESAPSSPRIR